MTGVTRLAAACMRRRRHHTLIFHRVLDRPDPMSPSEPTRDWFHSLIAMLSSSFEIISLSEAVSRAREGRIVAGSLSITFDDGYADNFLNALPVLEEFNAPATFFVASGYLDGGCMWNDTIIESMRRVEPGELRIDELGIDGIPISDLASRRDAAGTLITRWKHLDPVRRQQHVDRLAEHVADLPRDLMMTSEQLRRLARSPVATIGAHTRTHPILASTDDANAEAEIADGKRELEAITQQQIRLFAYPNGKFQRDYKTEHVEMVRRLGFDGAVATDWGTLDSATDLFQIPRFTPWHADLSRFALDLARCHYGLL